MGLYTGFDLRSSNTYVGIIYEDGKRTWKKKLRNDPSLDAFWLAKMLRLKILPEGYI